MKPNIAPQLQPLAIDIAALRPDPRNPRLHNARNLEAIAGSLKKFGQRKPVVVQKDGMIVRAGNGTVEAAKSLGWDQIAVVVVNDDTKMAEQYAVADNRSSELADWDFENLGAIINEWEDIDIPGFSQAELDVFLAAADDELTRVGGDDPVHQDVQSETGFAPRFEPKADTSEVNEQHIAAAQAKMQQSIRAEAPVKPVVCPECGAHFDVHA